MSSFNRLGDKKKKQLEKIANRGGGVTVDFSKLLKKYAPASKIEKIVGAEAKIKRTALSFLDNAPFVQKKDITSVALKTLKSYRERIKAGSAEKSELVDDPKQLVQRVQNAVTFQVTQSVKENYAGDFYQWLPSSANEPDPEHQDLYGKIFKVGEGDNDGNMPGERPGCQCGMQILVNETQLEL